MAKENTTPWLHLFVTLMFFGTLFAGASMVFGLFFRLGWSLAGG